MSTVTYNLICKTRNANILILICKKKTVVYRLLYTYDEKQCLKKTCENSKNFYLHAITCIFCTTSSKPKDRTLNLYVK